MLTALDPAADASDLHDMLSDARVHRYDTDARPSTSVEETEKRLSLQVMANGGVSWVIRMREVDRATGAARAIGPPLGTIGVVGDQGSTTHLIGWSLAPSYWQRGITREAACAVVPYLLAQDGVDGLEAWMDSRNVASVRVALATGMTERTRLPRRCDDHMARTVVMSSPGLCVVPACPSDLGV